MTSHYEFHTFHINIGVGDGSIHLLVNQSDGTAKPTIERAILMDGGEKKGEAARKISATRDQIQRTYQYSGGDTCLIFDTIIVTHWDEDHYKGMIEFLQEGFAEGYNSAGGDIKNAKIPFLRYSSDGKPATVLYAPYWFDDKKDKNQKDKSASPKTYFPGPSRQLEAEPSIQWKDNKKGATSGTYYLKMKPVIKKVRCERPDWPEVLLLQTGTVNILGINFLTENLATGRTVDITTPAQLLTNNPPTTGQPGVYCVAVNALVLGKDSSSEQDPPQHWIKRIRGVEDIVDDSSDRSTQAWKKNAASIVCMVLWENGQLSHYFGGDARWEVEKDIMDFWQKGGSAKGAGCLKLSHHGATNSTPLKMLDVFTPANIIVSANSKHGHPAWETLLYLNAWMRTRPSTMKPRVCVTNYPRYLEKDSTGNFNAPNKRAVATFLDVPPNVNISKPKAEVDFVTALRKYYTAMTPSVIDPWTQFWAQTWTTTDADARNSEQWAWLAPHLERAWLDLCEPRDRMMTAGLFSGAAAVAHMPGDSVLFFHVNSSSVDGGIHDGILKMKKEHDPFPVPLWSPVVNLIQASEFQGVAFVGPTSPSKCTAGLSVVGSEPPAKKPKPGDEEPLARRPKIPENNAPGTESQGHWQSLTDSYYGNAVGKKSRGTRDWQNESNNNELLKHQIKEEKHGSERNRFREEDEEEDNDSTSTKSNVDKNTPYYIYSSRCAPSDNASATAVSGTSLDNLLGALHSGFVVLDTTPTADETVSVESTDEWSTWLAVCLSASLAVTTPPAPATGGSNSPTSPTTNNDNASPGISDKNNLPSSSHWSSNRTISDHLSKGVSSKTDFHPPKASSRNNLPSSRATRNNSTYAPNINTNVSYNNSHRKYNASYSTIPGAKVVPLSFDAADGNASSPTTASNGNSLVAYFSLTSSIFPEGDNDTASLTFRSNDTCLKLAFGDDYSQAPTPGIVDGATLLVFGLDTTGLATLTTPLSRLLAAAYVKGIPSFLASLSPMIATLDVASSSDSTKRTNAVWFLPWQDYSTTARLCFTATPSCDLLNSLISSVLTGFSVSSLEIVLRTNATWLPGDGSDSSQGGSAHLAGSVTLDAQCIIATGGLNIAFEVTIGLSEEKIELTFLAAEATKDKADNLLTWLGILVNVNLSNVTSWFVNNKLSSSIYLRRVKITLESSDADSTVPSLAAFSVDLEVVLAFGTEGKESINFLFTYAHIVGQTFGSLTGGLWCQPPPAAAPLYQKLLPDWEDYDEFLPSGDPPFTLSLKKLFPNTDVENILDEIPTEITRASITISDDGLSFGGQLISDASLGDGPMVRLGTLSLDATYLWDGTITLLLLASVDIEAGPNTAVNRDQPAHLLGQVEYDSSAKSWSLTATINDLYGAALYTLFDHDSRDSFVQLLEHIEIPYAELTYQYAKGRGSFKLIGTLLLGPFELELLFQDDADGVIFNATLEMEDDQPASTTIGEIVASVFGDDSELPDFVANIEISAPVLTLDIKKEDDSFVLGASCTVGDVELSFARYRHKDWPSTVKSKQILKVSVIKLPSIKIPLVGDLSQPFDQLYYLRVQDVSEKNKSGEPAGLTRAEVDLVNEVLPTGKLLFKDTKKGGSDPQDVVISIGSHFVLALKNSAGKEYVLLDYSFKTSSNSSGGGDKSGEEKADEGGGDEPDESDSPDSDASMAPLHVSSGSLSISNIGFKYKHGVLSILLDAFIAVGPVSLALIGFSLGLDLKKCTLWELPKPEDIHISLDGLGAAFSRPPIELAGLFLHYKDTLSEYYAGGAIIAVKLYLFEAAGFYGTITNGDSGDKFISVFVFAKLDGPLIELEFGEISGITGGFGYNSSMRRPSPQEVPTFPFVDSQSLKGNPLKVLTSLTDPKGSGWFFPKDGSYWLAAGLKVDSFQILTISAVVVVQWDDALKLGIYAVGLADIPGTAISSSSKGEGGIPSFAHIEVGILATIDFAAGLLQVEAELSPSSFILNKDCHPTGGFALYYWFLPEGAHYGDWVFSIGGYHQAFQVPSWYPNPTPVGISWTLSDHFSIVGSSYFAITPNVCMAGGRLYAAVTVSKFTGFFDARADFLINYEPFHFNASISITIGIAYTTDHAITSSDVITEISATLQLFGPPIGGRAEVEFLIWHVKFDFGPDEKLPPPALTLIEFYDTVLQLKGTAIISEGGTIPDNQAHRLACLTGLIVQQDSSDSETKEDAIWDVRATSFSFSITCSMIVDHIYIGKSTISTDTPVYSKPMQLGGKDHLNSAMTVSLTSISSGADVSNIFSDKVSTGMVPKALWGEYDKSTDPSVSGNHINSLLETDTSPSLEAMTGLLISAPEAIPSDDPTFDVENTPVEEIDSEDPLPLPTLEQNTWLPASDSSSSSSTSSSSSSSSEEEEEEWDHVRRIWKKPLWSSSAQSTALDLWFSTFEKVWDLSSEKREEMEEEWVGGAMPDKLFDQFDSLYLELPRIAVGEDMVLPWLLEGKTGGLSTGIIYEK